MVKLIRNRKATVVIKAKIVLIFGASGSGKSTLLRELVDRDPTISIHMKGTDRLPKRYDSTEILCVPVVDDKKYDFIYQQYGHRYGIQKTQIDIALKNGHDHYIICNDIDTIRMIKKKYGKCVIALFLLFNAPRQHIEAVQKARGITDDQVDLRLAKIGVLSELFLKNSDVFDGVVLNKIGEPPSQMVSQVWGIVGPSRKTHLDYQLLYAKKHLREMVEIIAVIRNNLEHLTTNPSRSVIQPGYLFILMAMLPDDPILDDTHHAIQRAAIHCDIKAERVDDIAFTEQVTVKVLGSIRCAEFIVADITYDRPNVYYEIGYAHAHGKATILIARNGTKPHFDIQGFPIIFYKSMTDLEHQLIRFFESYQGTE